MCLFNVFQVADVSVAPTAYDVPRDAVMDFTYPFYFEYTVGLYRKSFNSKVCTISYKGVISIIRYKKDK